MSDHDFDSSLDGGPQRFDDLIARDVLGELTADERRELDRILADDPAAERQYREAHDTAARIHESFAATEAPPSLRESVLAGIETEPQDPPPGDTEQVPRRPSTPPPEAPVVDLEVERSRRRFGSAGVLGAVAAALLLVGGFVVATQIGQDEGSPIAAVVQADDAVARPLDGDLPGSIRIVHSSEENAIVVDATGLRSLGPGRTFQLWLVGDDAPQSVGVFRPDDDGRVEVRFDDVDPTDFVLGITEEPAGGSDEPTLPILAAA